MERLREQGSFAVVAAAAAVPHDKKDGEFLKVLRQNNFTAHKLPMAHELGHHRIPTFRIQLLELSEHISWKALGVQALGVQALGRLRQLR